MLLSRACVSLGMQASPSTSRVLTSDGLYYYLVKWFWAEVYLWYLW